MALSDLEIQTREFTVRGTSITLRGLCFSDLAYLIHEHRDDLDRVINRAKDQAETSTGDQQMVMELLQEVPDLAAKVIACAADEPGMAPKARALPFPVQLDMLMALGELTFEEAGGVKKFLADVVKLLQSTRTTLSDLNQPG